jgi:hypothetical protein
MNLFEDTLVGDDPEKGTRFEELPGLSTKNGWKEDPFRDRRSEPLVQTELFKWVYDPMYTKYREWTLVGFLIKNAASQEHTYERVMGNLNFRTFDKEKFKQESQSQKLLREKFFRREKRNDAPPCILRAEGMTELRRGVLPIPWKQISSMIVVNGIFPRSHEYPKKGAAHFPEVEWVLNSSFHIRPNT